MNSDFDNDKELIIILSDDICTDIGSILTHSFHSNLPVLIFFVPNLNCSVIPLNCENKKVVLSKKITEIIKVFIKYFLQLYDINVSRPNHPIGVIK